jgi:plasmid stabilization system protein ParE
MRNYLLGIAASQDVLNIWDSIANDNIDAADRLVKALFDAFEKLGRMPRMGQIGNSVSATISPNSLSIIAITDKG